MHSRTCLPVLPSVCVDIRLFLVPPPRFILLASRGETLPVHGAGDSVRSYLYVEDVAEAFLCVLHQGITGVCWFLHPRSVLV